MNFREARLDNGLQIVTELNPHVHSVALGFYVSTGSRDETPEVSGVSHFLEHMAFKGNERYTADDVNRIFDEIGAKYNASTSEEVTVYHAQVLPEYLPQAFEMLATLIQPSLRQDDFDMEKKVILEEIGMYKDQPSWVAYEAAMQEYFGDHPLGNSILGTTESIGALTSDQMRKYHREHYKAGNIVLALAGNTDWNTVEQLARQYCAGWESGTVPRPLTERKPKPGVRVIRKEENNQQQVAQMAPAPPATSPLRFAAELLSVIVGDYSNSRLYWELVDPAFAESADMAYNEYHGTGTYMTFLSGTPESTAENLARIAAIYESINRDGVTEAELDLAKNKVAARVVLRGERPKGRLSSLGGNWVYRREYRSVTDDLKTVQSVTTRDIRQLLEAYPLGQTATAAVGPLESLDGALAAK